MQTEAGSRQRTDLHPMPTLATGTASTTADPLPIRAHVIVWATLFALILLLAASVRFYDGHRVWDGWRESAGLRNSEYAERIYPDNLFRTQANTWSNLAYVAVGFYAFAFGWRDLRRPHPPGAGYLVRTPAMSFLVRTPAMSFLFGAGCCWLGVSSGFFHASLTRFGQQLDVASMYGPLLALVAISFGRRLPRVKLGKDRNGVATWPWLVGIVLLTSVVLFYFKWSMSSRVVLNALCGLVGACALLDRYWPPRNLNLGWLGWAIVALVVGTSCRQIDVAGRFTGPDAWLQGHAFWHLFTATSLGCMYLYYRSETDSIPANARPE
jgi:predicted membrane channel-forming protein YqfA (hemolysin III family)